MCRSQLPRPQTTTITFRGTRSAARRRASVPWCRHPPRATYAIWTAMRVALRSQGQWTYVGRRRAPRASSSTDTIPRRDGGALCGAQCTHTPVRPGRPMLGRCPARRASHHPACRNWPVAVVAVNSPLSARPYLAATHAGAACRAPLRPRHVLCQLRVVGFSRPASAHAGRSPRCVQYSSERHVELVNKQCC
ncbi:hypothetical protein PHLGIDRAFT_340886 [Phlebiopsis gigantea 11061_1 CR5-6]|uniref:Uncharacterized protein n=1 Tax=Phlebiopsis gigantea (strain 11061_1 CR5-6) TaxID=745531 RepID=A0A0C3RZ60_PHLG1|nr:hypothetical protein PHLGIDRAFT_340886 [Phlebiopsis gigantea 11061_1 CR5-6]